MTTDQLKGFMNDAWNAAVAQAMNVQEKGWGYTPLTFEQWFLKNSCDIIGHYFQPIIGFDNIIAHYACSICGEKEVTNEQ
ncbi:hypothetical protein [Chitinophaga nivalis]|uniref:Uncharacterized protein n=1 Tax=Chitinophaga nivalis TaxID=2991709 RepID=A0ABT3IIK0_9BACT|nr:hypothetical protein [Chitinophaga nivalis]MCW3466547.1 hypothetical protein [Chitinophaga nivalis]MCW3483762.1 hypothetical protein [Chitinophaga nivalis]